jgi:putative ribosome biogenesis GTPase RsgA
VIETVQQRTSLLYRSDAFKEKIIAANVTQIIIVVAATPSFSEELINRCLVAAESENIKVLIVLNKADLIEPTQTAMETLSLYQRSWLCRIAIKRNAGYFGASALFVRPPQCFGRAIRHG